MKQIDMCFKWMWNSYTCRAVFNVKVSLDDADVTGAYTIADLLDASTKLLTTRG
jgi:hypothetical protein